MFIPSKQAISVGTPALPVELLYVWINQDETGFVKKNGFNFSPNYTFTMTENNDGTHLLSWAENCDCPNVWNTEKILNLTAVVGKNGTGKSALLKHLVNAPMLPVQSGSRPDVDGDNTYGEQPYDINECSKMVQVFRSGDSLRVIHNLDEEHFATNPYIDSSHISVLSADDNPLHNQTRIYMTNAYSSSRSMWESVRKDKPIIFSPTGNYERADLFFKKTCGLELAKALINPNKDYDRAKKLDPLRAFCYLQDNIASHKTYKDFERLCAISYYHLLHSLDTSNAQIISDSKDLIISVANFFTLTNQATNKKSDYYDDRYLKALTTIQAAFKGYQSGARGKKPISDVLHAYLDFEERYLSLISKKYRTIYQLYTYYSNAYSQVDDLVSIIEGILPEPIPQNSSPNWRVAERIRLKYGSEAYNQFCEFIDQQMRQEHSFILKYLTIELPSQSSGEYALQNTFSWLRLLPSFHEILGEESVTIHNNILLLLDEADLYMHPEWQRQFLYAFSEKLKNEFPDKYIQIIISTHSPLMLSDVPSGNVIYLEKDQANGTCSRKPITRETFGANLFSLLKDSFFLDKSLGEFAHHTIRRVIEDLEILKKLDAQKNQIQNDDLRSSEGTKQYAALCKELLHSDEPLVETEFRKKCKNYRRTIDLIGEPMLRGKLREMYEDLFPEEDLNKRNLDKLRQLLESSDPNERRRYQKLLSDMLPTDDSD